MLEKPEGFNFPLIIHNLILDINKAEGVRYIELVDQLKSSLCAYNDPKFEAEVKEIKNNLINSNKLINGSSIVTVVMSPQARAALDKRYKDLVSSEHLAAKAMFEACIGKIQRVGLMPERVIWGVIE